MKTTTDNPLDPLGSLGAPIRSTKPAAAPVPVAPGIVRGNDGKLQTTEKPKPLIDWRYGNPIAPVVHQDDCED
jgi:hypothetical protein